MAGLKNEQNSCSTSTPPPLNIYKTNFIIFSIKQEM